MNTRCINLDWLEVYCHESPDFYPMNAQFYRDNLWHVVEREYGTRVYADMFVLYGTDNERLLEIRRNPLSNTGYGQQGILDPYSCHIRLCNRTCYFNDAVNVLRDFLARYHYTVIRISRIDICLDFEKFDSGDDPAKFIERYMSGKYSKLNQAKIRSVGVDRWDGRKWNSLAWGSPTSCVSTKMYLKTLELKEVSDKPYIRQAWKAAGLVDDATELTKNLPDGTTYQPDIWRVEFSVKSGTRNWFLIEDQSGKRPKKRSIRHTLAMYDNREKLLNMFLSLAEHYFHFKKVEYINPGAPVNERQLQRKDRCKDKQLFKVCEANEFYKLENVATATPSNKSHKRLIQLLQAYQEHCIDPAIYKACDTLLAELLFQQRRDELTHPWPMSELTILRQLIAKRIHGSNAPLSQDLAETRALLQVEQDIFGEVLG